MSTPNAKEIKASPLAYVKTKKGLFESATVKRQIIVTKDKLVVYKDEKEYFKVNIVSTYNIGG
jgi:maltodextrin utilization protein YvdJ